MLIEIPVCERSKGTQQYLVGSPTDDRVLGIQWNVNDDQFTFDVKLTLTPSTVPEEESFQLAQVFTTHLVL